MPIQSRNNTSLPATRHAVTRCEQRSIPAAAVELIMTYGEDMPAAAGRTRRYIRFQQANELIGDGISVETVNQALHITIIVENELIITCYHHGGRTCRLPKSQTACRRMRRSGRGA